MPSGCTGMLLIYRYGFLVFFLYPALTSLLVSSSEVDYLHCEAAVKNWADSSSERGIIENELRLKDLLFFLHIPRTGGRTYFHCFLRKLYTTSQECPRSYDKLRFDPSKPNCRLTVAHDDYSLMSKLPKDRTSVVSILRDPIDRVFSTYEFSVEVAARFLVHPNLTSATRMSRRIRPKSRGVSTLDIWPWKYLVPWMIQDLFARRDARGFARLRETEETSNPYEMKEMVMPLSEFINDPIAYEIIHNGATFQVAGLTNNSYMEESHNVRNCVKKHPELGHFVLEVAKHRLDHMLYVGLTEEHKKSATMFAKLVGAQVLSQSERLDSNFKQETSDKTETTSFSDHEADGINHVEDGTNHEEDSEVPSATHDEPERKNMTIGKVMEAYETCILNLRKSQASRRSMSLKRIAPANFSKQARRSVPTTILQQIQYLNSLDVELYKHAQCIFMQRQKLLMHNAVDTFAQPEGEGEVQKAACGVVLGCSPWNVFWAIGFLVICACTVIILLLLLVTTKKRTSKLKL